MNAPKKPAKPKLETRIKRWYQGDQDEDEGAELLAEWYGKQLKKKPQNPGRRSRAKGAEFERLVANRLKALWPTAERNTQWKGGKKDGADIEGTPWFIEAKNCASLQLGAWWRQAEHDCDERPVAIIYSVQNSPVIRVQVKIDLFGLKVRADFDFEDWLQGERKRNGLKRILCLDGEWEIWSDGILGVIQSLKAADSVLYQAQRVEWVDGCGEVYQKIPNTAKKAKDGLWPTLDAAEAAIRKEVSDD